MHVTRDTQYALRSTQYATTDEIISVEDTHTSGAYPKRPIALVRGQGARVWDADGREYIDCIAGHGVAGLQEAGWLSIDIISFPSIELLGVYPTMETLISQLAVILLVGFIFLRGRFNGREEANNRA